MAVLKRFLSYVEIKTKITSVFPFLMTLAYLFYTGIPIKPLPTLIFFLGMLCFDLTATTINNYFDTKKNHQTLQFRRYTALSITVVLFFISAALGIYLFYLTDTVVLILGGLCFIFGVLYSFGPLPISHIPLGEFVSGLFYGLMIPVIIVYINTPRGALLSYFLREGKLLIELNVRPAISLLLLSVLPFCLTANIMLANNICDLSHDVKVGRFTLAYYLKEHSLRVFSLLYYLAYASVIVMVVMGFLSPLSLILLITIIQVQKNINVFNNRQIKEETFIISIKNFLLIIVAHTILIFAGGLLSGWAAK